jgi:hypothetical protein
MFAALLLMRSIVTFQSKPGALFSEVNILIFLFTGFRAENSLLIVGAPVALFWLCPMAHTWKSSKI